MKKKILTLVLPAVAMVTAGCGPEPEHQHSFSDDWKTNESSHWHECECGEVSEKADHVDTDNNGVCDVCLRDMSQPTPENRELEKFNELVSAIKANHNYTLSIHSLVEGLEDQELNCHRYNLNDKAWYHDDSVYFDAEGIIYQKDQGYVTFVKNGNNIVPTSLASDFDYETDPRIFVSTNPALKISDITEITGENLFVGSYQQDATDKTKFTTTNIDNRAVAAYLTQYFGYISTGQLQIADSMDAVVDVTNSTITLELNYTLWYFDEVEVKAPGVITIELENVGSTSDEVIQNYIENPAHPFEAPAEWPSNMSTYFTELYNSVTPTLPTGLSYAAVCEKILHDGFYYAGIQDVNSGDLRTSYGQTLLNEGFTKVSDNNYKKVIINGINSVTYKVIMKYVASSTLFPNGEMYILFRADKQSGVFASIADFNTYLASNDYDELVPSLPEEATCTSISNFKDTTDNELYALKVNSTDTFRVNIPDYDKATAFANAYADALIAKGYSDTSKFLSMTNYSLEWSTSGTYVGMDFPTTAAEYTGYVGLRFVVWKVDEESLRPAPEAVLDHIAVSEMTTSYEVGESFSFDGVCTAYYSDESNKEVEPTYVSKPDMTTTGQKTIIVKFTDHDVEKQTSYTINVSEASAKPVSLAITGFYNTQFIKDGYFDHSGMCVTATYDDTSTKIVTSNATFDYDLSEAGIKTVTVSYTEDGVTVSDTYNILVSEDSLKWPSLNMAENEDVELEYFSDSEYEKITNFNYNNHQYFYVDFVTPAEIEDIYLDEDPNADVVLDYEYGAYKIYKITPSKTLEISSYTLVVQTKALTKYNVTIDSSIENGSLDLNGKVKFPAGSEVDIYYQADEGYEIETISIVDHPEINVQWYDYGGFYWFEMPDYDVEITATFKLIPVSHSITAATGLENGTVTRLYNWQSLAAGEQGYIKVTPNAGYQVESVYVVGHEGEVEFTYNPTNKYYGFTMPDYDIVVAATFSLIPKDLSSISISGQKTEFTVGDDFDTGDLVVTANYANGEKGTVTGYSVDSTKVDMNTAGDYKVTVSYTEGGITKSQEYGISVKGSDVTSTVYSGETIESTYIYDYSLTINSDGTGTYVLTQTKRADSTVKTYTQYFTWTDAGSGKINIVKDSSKTSTYCTLGKYNLWYDSPKFDPTGSNKNVIAISGSTATFDGRVYNDERYGQTLTLTIVE